MLDEYDFICLTFMYTKWWNLKIIFKIKISFNSTSHLIDVFLYLVYFKQFNYPIYSIKLTIKKLI